MEISWMLARVPLFAGIGREDLPGLLDCVNAREREFQKGDVLLHRGDRTASLGLVLSGTVQVIREDFWGNRSVVGLVEAGEIFAESYALAGQPLEVSVQAVSPGRVLFLNGEKMISGCAQVCGFHEQLSRNLLSLLARKNLMLTEKMRHMARKTTREKLLSYLSAQAVRAGAPEFDIPMDRQQLADFLGVERSAMSATLSRLRDEGVLEFHKSHFRLLRQEEDQEV